MILGKVIGEIVATTKAEGLIGKKILIVQSFNAIKNNETGNQIICVDAVGAGRGDSVLISSGSSGRIVFGNDKDVPSDAVVVAIIDSIQTEESD